MRLLFVAFAIALFAGCVAPSTSTRSGPPPTATRILVDGDVLLGPGALEARFPYGAAGNVSSGSIRIELAGTATSVTLEAPTSCRGAIAAPGPTGTSVTVLDCEPMTLGQGDLVLRAPTGTAQGRIAFAVTQVAHV